MFFVFIIVIFAALFILKHFIEKSLREDQGKKQKIPGGASPERRGSVHDLSSRRIPKVSFAWTWMQCAGKFGYTYLRQGNEHLYPSIEGSEGSCRIFISAVPGKSRKQCDTLMSAEFPISAGLGLCLVKGEDLAGYKGKGIAEDAGMFFESQTMKDLVLFVEDGERFRRAYAVVCEKFLLKNWAFYEDFTLTDHSFLLRFRGTDQKPERFEEMIESLVDAAQCFSALSEHAAGSVLPEETHSDAQTGIRQIPEPTEVPEKPVVPEAEETGAPVQQEEIVQEEIVQEEIVQEEIVQEEIVQEEIVQEEIVQETSPAPPGEKVFTSAEHVIPVGEPDKETLIASLWSSSFPGSAEKQLFETQYKGKKVCWEGILCNSFPYSFDFVFGREPGVKSSVELLEISRGNSSFKVKIKALVSFPPEEEPCLRKANRKSITFQGTLLKYEALSGELYLTDGRIVSIQDC